MALNKAELAAMIDHTLLRPEAKRDQFLALCEQAVQHGFRNVSINPVWVRFCARVLHGTDVGINPTVGFPLGANTAYVKAEEARDALQNGATELDMVINIGAIRSGYPSYIEKEIRDVCNVARHVPVKVILETGYLTENETRIVCEIAKECGAAFVKTSTGFGKRGASAEDVALMREVVGPDIGVKAAGGIRTYTDAVTMIEAGANRIGTSASVELIEDAPA